MDFGGLLKSGRESLLGRRGTEPSVFWLPPHTAATIAPANRSDRGAVALCIDERYGATGYFATSLKDSIRSLLLPYHSASILKFAEYREKASEFQVFTLLFYQSFVIMEISGEVVICAEEYNGTIEVMCGCGSDAMSYASQYRANGEKRNTSLMQDPLEPAKQVTVMDFLNWLSSPAAPAEVLEKGFVGGLISFLTSADAIHRESLAGFLDEDALNIESVGSVETTSQTRKESEATQISLMVIPKCGDSPSGRGGMEMFERVFIEPWKKVSELQTAAEAALGKPLVKLSKENGQQLDPEFSIVACGLVEDDAVIAELYTGVE